MQHDLICSKATCSCSGAAAACWPAPALSQDVHRAYLSLPPAPVAFPLPPSCPCCRPTPSLLALLPYLSLPPAPVAAKMYKALKDTDDAYRADGLVWRTELAGEPKVWVGGLCCIYVGRVVQQLAGGLPCPALMRNDELAGEPQVCGLSWLDDRYCRGLQKGAKCRDGAQHMAAGSHQRSSGGWSTLASRSAGTAC